MYKHLLIPTDGSPLSQAAARSGVKLAHALGAKVTAFFAAPAPTPLVYERFVPAAYGLHDAHGRLIEEAARKYLRVIERACEKAGVPCRSMHVVHDDAAQAILDAARRYKCDLIFMGSHSRRRLSALLLGSHTQKVICHSKVPVLVHR